MRNDSILKISNNSSVVLASEDFLLVLLFVIFHSETCQPSVISVSDVARITFFLHLINPF